MRKVLSLLVAVAFLAVAGSTAFAAFTSVSSSTMTAKVVFTVAGTFDWDISIRNVVDDAVAPEITWDGTTLPSGWGNALQYVMITSTATKKAGIQVYTDNLNGTVYKKSISVNQDTNTYSLGGLVDKAAPLNPTIPMAWSLKDAKVTGGATVNPVHPTDEAIKFGSLYFADRSNTLDDADNDPFVDGGDYNTILKGGSGWRWGGGDNDIGGSASGTFYMYIGADFSAAAGETEYGTDTLTFEGYTE